MIVQFFSLTLQPENSLYKMHKAKVDFLCEDRADTPDLDREIDRFHLRLDEIRKRQTNENNERMKKEQKAFDYTNRWTRKTRKTSVPSEPKEEEREEPPKGEPGSASSSSQAPKKEKGPYQSFATGLNKKVQFHTA